MNIWEKIIMTNGTTKRNIKEDYERNMIVQDKKF